MGVDFSPVLEPVIIGVIIQRIGTGNIFSTVLEPVTISVSISGIGSRFKFRKVT